MSHLLALTLVPATTHHSSASRALHRLPCGQLESDVALAADADYVLSCQLFVGDGRTLRVDPGVTVFAQPDPEQPGVAPSLVVEQGGKLHAEGTAAAPITFTSWHDEEAPIDRQIVSDSASLDAASGAVEQGVRGKWGGLVLLGRAPINARGGTNEVEGLSGRLYGGSDPTDSSGVLRYVRVWHGGAIVGEDNEINGITFAGVGNGTVVDHVEVAFSLDDGFEFFGGTVNVKHLSSLFAGDDAFDTDEGYQGKGQFLFAMTGLQGHHGLESDSSSDAAAQPRSRPRWTSVTVLGGGARGRNDALLAMRKGTAGTFANLALGFAKDVGIAVQACPVGAAFVEDGEGAAADDLSVELPSVVFAGPTAEPLAVDEASCAVRRATVPIVPRPPVETFAHVDEASLDFDNITLGFDPLPASSGSLCSAGVVAAHVADDDPFFEPVRCVGAFGGAEAAANWLKGWSKLDERWQMPPPPPPGPPSSPPAAPPPSEPPLVADDSVPQLPVIVTGGVLLLLLVIAIVCRFKHAHNQRDERLSGKKHKSSAFNKWFRSLGKPFRRWTFRQGRRFTDEAIGEFSVKYLTKYLLKRQKLGLDAKRRRDEVERIVRATRAAHDSGTPLLEALTSEAADLGQTPPPREYVGYADALEYALRANIGLSHAKAREYWIYRGPRQVVLVACALLVVLLVQELINPPTPQSRLASAVASVAGLLSALVMLYYRLPDSIRSGVSRSAHDHYVKSKRRIEKRSSSASLAASMSGSIGVGTSTSSLPKMTTMQSLAMHSNSSGDETPDTTPSGTPKQRRSSASRRTSGSKPTLAGAPSGADAPPSSRRWTSSFLSRRPPSRKPSKAEPPGGVAPAALHAALEDIPGSPPAVPTAKSKAGVVSFSCSSCSSDEAPELFEASAPGPGGRRVQRMGSHAVISSEQLSASLDEEAAASSASSSATATPVIGPSAGNSPATTADPAQLAEALVAAGAAPARSSRLAAAPAAGWEERPEAALEAARRSEKAAPFV